jgi:hypothetical protein
MTVTWHEAALAELAERFLEVVDKARFRAAVDEIDMLLRVNADDKESRDSPASLTTRL